MTDAPSVLAAARSILVVDWPTRDVPDALALAGLEVVVHGGPGPEDYVASVVEDGEVVERQVGRPPDHADIVYTHRPLDELTEIVSTAVAVGARAVWVQSGLDVEGEKDPRGCWMADEDAAEARAIVESAGLLYVDRPYIADTARELGRG